MKPRKSTHRLWALFGHNGGSIVTSGNVPALYWSKQEAWYDGNDDLETREVIVEVRELPRRKRKEKP